METKKSNRLQSLDAFRGFDMFFIMGGATLLASFSEIWSNPFTDWLANQMQHVDWHGFRHHDSIFPLSLFIAGVSFPYSLANKLEKRISQINTERHIPTRVNTLSFRNTLQQ